MIIVLSGKNTFTLHTKLAQLTDKAQRDTGDFGIEHFDASELSVDVILQAVQSIPFLAPAKLVIITNAQSSSALMERVHDIYDRTADQVTVVFVGPIFDKRQNTWKLLKKYADEVHEYVVLKPFELPRWLVQHAKTNGVQITQLDAQYLIDRVGTSQLLLQSELQKIAITTNAVTRSDIDCLTEPTPQSTIFSMLDAVFTGKKDRAITLYREQRSMRVDPHYIVAMLVWQLQSLALAVYANPQTEQILAGAGQSSFVAKKALGLAKKLTTFDVKRSIDDLLQLDIAIKSYTEPDAAIELYLLSR